MAPENLNGTIIDFLNSASTTKKLTRCICGTMREHRETTFFYNGQSWEAELPVCPNCSGPRLAPTHDA
jgi:hypothetical protein